MNGTVSVNGTMMEVENGSLLCPSCGAPVVEIIEPSPQERRRLAEYDAWRALPWWRRMLTTSPYR